MPDHTLFSWQKGGGGVLLNFENDRRTPLDPPVHLVGGTIIITKIRVHGSVFRLPGGQCHWPPGSPNTESCTHLLVIVPPTKCTYCTGEANTYLDMGDMDALASALHGVTVGTGRTQT